MTTEPDAQEPPAVLGHSLALGLVFVCAWLGFTAVNARDGRMPITDWLDPFLAGATLLATLAGLAALIVLWRRLPPTLLRRAAAGSFVTAQWTYIAGEILSNTVTIGEPPADIGGLLEIGSGAVTVLGVLAVVVATFGRALARQPRSTKAVTIAAAVLAIGTAWWFSHPIDQSTPATPACVPGNALYNAVHGTDC